MLEYRLQNDSEYKSFKLEVEIAVEELKKAQIASFSNLELGISDGVFSFSKEKDRQGYSFSPYLNFSLPIYNNSGLKLSAPISKMGDASTNAFNFSVFTEIYGTSRKMQKLLLSSATEKRDKALQKLKRGEKYVEKKLLKELGELFSAYMNFLDKNLKEVQGAITLDQLKVQGYGESSAKMRTSKLSHLATEREMKEAEFLLETKYNKFIKDSVEGGKNEGKAIHNVAILLDDMLTFLPKDKLLNLDLFSEDNYIAIQDAKNAYKMSLLKNKLDLNPLTITGEAGFSHSKKTFDSSIPYSREPITKESMNAGVGLKMPGAKIMAGLDFPIDTNRKGDIGVKFGFALNPLEIWSYTKEKKKIKAKEKIDELKVQDSIEEFQTFFSSLKTKKAYLEWQSTLASEELSIYKENVEENARYLDRGLISNSEKMQAEIEYSKAKLRCASAQININSFNIETYLLFNLE